MYWLRGRISPNNGDAASEVRVVEEALANVARSRRMNRSVLAFLQQDDPIAIIMFQQVVKPECDKLGLMVDLAGYHVPQITAHQDPAKSVERAAVIVLDLSGANPETMFNLGKVHDVETKGDDLNGTRRS